MAFKLVINNPKDGKSYQTDFEDKTKLIGKKVGTSISGSLIGLSGYELEITGGSDICGNPMRKDVDGPSSRRLLLTKGIGFKSDRKGERRKKRVHGRTISDKIIQINLKVTKTGSKKLDELIGSEKEGSEQKEGTEESKSEESKSEEKKPDKKEEKKEEKEKVEPKEKEEKKTTNNKQQTTNNKESPSKETENSKTDNDNKEA